MSLDILLYILIVMSVANLKHLYLFQKQRPKRVKALYNCKADNPDELSFSEGEVIIVDGEEDKEWWVSTQSYFLHSTCTHQLTESCVILMALSCVLQVGHIDGEPNRKGVFPVSFVYFITH